MRLELDESWIDYRYYRDKGWFESDYYYPTHLDPLKQGVGKLIDSLFTVSRRKGRRTECPVESGFAAQDDPSRDGHGHDP